MTTIINAKPSTLIDSDLTTMVTMSRETCVQLVTDLTSSLAGVGTSRLVLRTSDGRFLLFKIEGLP